MNRLISVAIPYYNNCRFMRETLEHIINDERINEIIICDDKSKDLEELEQLLSDINCNKITLHKNEQNLGCYHNKLHTLTKCTNDWTILLDSDNIIGTDYIDKLFAIPEWNNNIIYASSWAQTFPNEPSIHLNFTKFANMTFDNKLFLETFNDNNFQCLINDCNYFVPRVNYINCMNKYTYDRYIIDSLDSAVLFSDWLCNNGKVYVVPDMIYRHRCHPQSNYVLSKSHRYANDVKRNIINKVIESVNKN